MNWKLYVIAGAAGLLALAGCTPTEIVAENTAENKPVERPTPEPAAPPVKVEITVNKTKKILVELYPGKAPETTKQILDLVDSGFYNGQRIHRVEDWVIQWGDPQSKKADWKTNKMVGSQGSGKQLPYEATDVPMVAGTVAMASTGEQVGGDSQLFILTSRCTADQASFLQGKYCGFGKVLSGQDVVDSVKQGDEVTMKRAAG